MTIPEISRFLTETHLRFMGFNIDARTLQRFRQRFPWTDAAADINLWHLFENENPDTFIGMYQFWVQKQPDATV